VKFHAFHHRWKWRKGDDKVFLFGFAGGRVKCDPQAKWLYSLRLFLGPLKLEILWMTGVNPYFDEEEFCA
jgi:hypothetical protein